MQIVHFTEKWLKDAKRLAMENYVEERVSVQALPQQVQLPPLEALVQNGLTVAAVENEKLLGFLGAYDLFEPAFCTRTVRGVFSPVHAHAVIPENRRLIWQRLYQAAAEKWVRAGAASHAIALYAHDEQAAIALYQYGFGMRCMDLILQLTDVQPVLLEGVTCAEADPAMVLQEELRGMRRALAAHMSQSPCFMLREPEALEKRIRSREESGSRVFAARKAGRMIAYIEVEKEGETFVSCAPTMRNICGAYCVPEERGTGAAQALLHFVINAMHTDGYMQLGVNCESINPTALNFWTKMFAPYTRSVVRRIDDNALSR